MPGILDECEELFGTQDCYKIFGVTKSVNDDQMKKAYYKVSLKVHPDKVTGGDKSEATQKFQLLCKLYQLLSDKKKREIYNKTGELDEEDGFGLSDGQEWADLWRELFPVISTDQIDKFQTEYQGSIKELSDLKAAYVERKGDMQKILDCVLCCTYEDEERFRAILDPLIESGELPTFSKYTNESTASKKKRQAKAKKEAAEADKMKKTAKGRSSAGYDDLALAMKRNSEKRGGILSYLEAKYCTGEDESEEVVASSKKSSKRSKSQNKSTKAKKKRAA